MRLNTSFACTYEHRSRDVSSRKLMNVLPESTDGLGKEDPILVGRAGQKRFADYSQVSGYETLKSRGVYYTSTSRLFVVFGNKLCEIDGAGVRTERHTIGLATSRVYMTDDGIEMIIVDGYVMYIYNLETNVVIIPPASNVDFTSPTKVVYANGRAVAINNDPTFSTNENQVTRRLNRFYWSDLRDFATWNPLWFATAEQSADPITSIAVRDNDIWLFGPRSYEIWRNNPNDPDQPYEYVGGSSSEIGCISPDSVASIESKVFWLGASSSGLNHVYMSDGYNAVDITTSAISQWLSTNQTLTIDATGFCYVQEGHTFYVLTFIQLDRTFVYDLTMKSWHERSTRDPKLNIHHKWRPCFSTFAFNRVIVADLESATLYTLDPNYFMDDIQAGQSIPIVHILQTPNISAPNGQRIFVKSLWVDAEVGGTPITDPTQFGYDPKLMLEVSRDGGYQWGNQTERSMGVLGQNRKRMIWHRKGSGHELAFRLTHSSPNRFCLISIEMETF